MTDLYVGIDTSNYTTSAAVCSADGIILANLKIPLPVKEGGRGLRQSDAVFEHVRNLPELMKKLSGEIRDGRVKAIGVSTRPRDAEGSYMPCFLSGRSAAYSLAAASNAPVYELSHQNGHIMAALYSSDSLHLLDGDGFFAFHVSGGTTELLLVTPSPDGFDVKLVGETDDINAGQAIDRIGVAMGMKFPAGREMEALAGRFEGKIHKHPVSVKDGRCSLSGAENIALRLRENEGDAAAAAFVFDFICRTLCAMRDEAFSKHGKRSVVYAGGVMSNRIMRKALADGCDAYFAEPEFSADNAAGIALLCRERDKIKI